MNFLNDLYDFERVNSSSVLLIKNDGERILIKNISEKFLDDCYDALSKKINTSENKKTKDSISWTEDDIIYLKNNFYLDLKTLSLNLNKSTYQVSCMVGKLKLTNKTSWTKEEEVYLVNNIHKKNSILAEELNRTIYSIKSKKRILQNYYQDERALCQKN